MARFLLCHAPFGSGHTVAKEAIEEAISKNHSEAECLSVDVFSYLPTWITQGMIKSYLWILRHCPSLYRCGYRLSDHRGGSSLLMRFVVGMMKKHLLMQICAYRPDIIVCTHATPTMVASALTEDGMIDMPVVAVVTDYVVHRAWMHRQVARYFVAHEGLIDRLCVCGLSASQVVVSGIPVRSGFCPREKTCSVRRILVMGGGMGLVDLSLILRAVMRMDEPAELHVITGSEKRRQTAEMMARTYPYPIIIEGYSRCVDEAMRRSSLLITKAGGVSVAESLAIGIPLILFGSLAGQEEANSAFLSSCGAAVAVNNEEELYQRIREIFCNENGITESMMAAQAHLRRPNSAEYIAQELDKMIQR